MREKKPETTASAEGLFTAGRTLDHYQIIRLIGQGGMGEVYLSRDTKLGRKVALKVIRAKALGDGAAAGRFVQEARVTARFNHPNIVTIYGVGEVEGSPYVALEYLEGQDLHERLDEQAPSFVEAVRIARTIAEALAEAHRHDVLHRDLKPENVLMARDGRLRVLDFGLAKLVGEPPSPERPTASADGTPSRLNQTGADFYDTLVESQAEGLRGTPLYMAPEQWRNGSLSPATDIFAFGLVMHELFTGRHPLAGMQFFELSNRVLDAEPLPSVATAGGLPDTLVGLVDRCLDKDPTLRPSAPELVDGLSALVAQERPASLQEDNPFRGLLPFTEQNADAYYGRDAEIAAFLERLRVEPVLPVAGPSGAGKSSFVGAGVIPRLKEQGRWMVIRMRPGRQPFQSLALRFTTRRGSDSAPFQLLDETQLLNSTSESRPRKLSTQDEAPEPTTGSVRHDSILGADAATRLATELLKTPARLALRLTQLAETEQGQVLLFVDQLEELYSLVDDAAVRRAFMEAICSAADDPEGPVRVIFTLRDDFLGRLAEGPEARQVLGNITVLRSPEPAVLEEIVRRPVADRGYAYEDDALVSEMVATVQGEAAALALLQFAGHRLWEQRDKVRRVLRRDAYQAMGGVAGALIQHTDQVLEGLAPAQERAARALFLRLVTPDSTRRVVPRAELLAGLGPQAPDVLDRLTEARVLLVRKGRKEAELELVHESLITVWDRLGHWIEESREERVFVHELEQATALWVKRGRRADEVWSDDALRDAQRKAARCNDLAEPLQRFLDAGEQLARRRRNRRRFVYGLGIFGLVAVAIAAVVVSLVVDGERRQAEQHRSVALQQKQSADTQRQAAETARAAALAESAKAAMLRGAFVEARAKVRGALELQDSHLARALWWRLQRDPLYWRKAMPIGATAARFSPDGQTLAVSLLDGTIQLVDTQTQSVRVLRGHDDQIFAMAYGHDNHTLVSGDWSGRILLWDLRRGTYRPLNGHKRAVRGLHVQPGGHLLASGSSDKTVRLWDLRTLKQVRVVEPNGGFISRVRFSPDGQRLASAHHGGEVKIWDVATGKLQHTLKAHTGSVKSLAFRPDGLQLASGSTDRTVLVWDVTSGKLVHKLAKTGGRVYGLRYSPDGKQLASSHLDKLIRLWDAETGRQLRTLSGHSAGIYSLDFSRDGRFLASASTDRSVRVWRTTVPGQSTAIAGHSSSVYGVVFDPMGRFLASGGADRTIRLWNLSTGTVTRVLSGHDKGVTCLAMQPNGRLLASTSKDSTIRLWNVDGGFGARGIHTRGGAVQASDFSPDGTLLAIGGYGSRILLMDIKRRVIRHSLRGHNAQVNGLRFSPDGRLLATTSGDRTVRLWDVKTGRALHTISGFGDQTRGVVFSVDSRHLYVGSDDRKVYRLSVKGGPPQVVARFQVRPYWLDLSPDGHTLGVPCSGGSTWLLDLKTSKRRRLHGHRDDANTLAFEGTGKRLATVSDDGTVRLWSTATGRPLWRGPLLSESTLELFTHRGVERVGPNPPLTRKTSRWRQAVLKRARLAAESRDGKHLCLGTNAGNLELWNLTEDKRLWRRSLPGVTSLLGLPTGCATLSAGTLRLHDRRAQQRTVATKVLAATFRGNELLIALKSGVQRFDAGGKPTGAPLVTGLGVTALGRAGDWIVVGFRDGAIELLHTSVGKERSSFSFEGVPASAVTRLLAGPQHTLLAGFANGTVGLWSLQNGTLLGRHRLHGSVNHLLRRQGRVYASTDLGQHHVLDLRLFALSRCAVLKQVWSRVGVRWQNGLAVKAHRPRRHPCLSTVLRD